MQSNPPSRGQPRDDTRKVAMTNITTPRLADANARTDLEQGAPSASTPEARTSRTDDGRRGHLAALLAVGIAVGAAALAVVAIATDDAGSEPVPPATATVVAGQPPTAQPPAAAVNGVPDGVPCPDGPIRGRPTVC
jgi:hypothetical protein